MAYQRYLNAWNPDIWNNWAESDPDSASSWADYYWGQPEDAQNDPQTWYDWTESDPDAASSWADHYWGTLYPDTPWEEPPVEVFPPGLVDPVPPSSIVPAPPGLVDPVPPGVEETPVIPDEPFLLSETTTNSADWSGIDWTTGIAADILPSLTESALGLPELAGQSGDILQDQYESIMRMALGPDAFQGTLNDLTARNMLESKVASDTLTGAAVPIAMDVANRSYQSQLEALNMQMQVPGLLAEIANLGQVSIGDSKNYAEQWSNPLDAWELLAEIGAI